jgi:hypothetical protein
MREVITGLEPKPRGIGPQGERILNKPDQKSRWRVGEDKKALIIIHHPFIDKEHPGQTWVSFATEKFYLREWNGKEKNLFEDIDEGRTTLYLDTHEIVRLSVWEGVISNLAEMVIERMERG